jgi:hypothetical protein
MQKVTVIVLTQPRGYPSLATLLKSHENFMIYRRFGYLQARLLLEKQSELCALERTLDQLDRKEAQEDARQPMTRDLSDDRLSRRNGVLNLIGEKFCSYGEYNSNLKIGAV